MKEFPDGTTQYLSEDDAFFFERESVRNYFRDAKLAMKPKGSKGKPPCPPS